MQTPRVLRKFNLSFQDSGWAGICSEVELPDFQLITEQFRGGGQDMAAKIHIGMEIPEIMFTMEEHVAAVQRKFGRSGIQGRFSAAQSNGVPNTGINYSVSFTGLFEQLTLGTATAGEGKSPMKGKISCAVVTVMHAGTETIHIDGPNGIFRSGGEDLLQELRELAEIG